MPTHFEKLFDFLVKAVRLISSAERLKKGKDKMFTLRRLGLAVITLPIALAGYTAIYFVLAGFAEYASIGLLISNLWAVGFGWIVAVTFSKQIIDLVGRLSD